MSIRRDGKSLQQNWQWLELCAIQKQNYHNLNSFFEIRNNFLKRKHLRISKRQQQYQNAKQNEQKWKRRQTQNIRKYFLFLTFYYLNVLFYEPENIDISMWKTKTIWYYPTNLPNGASHSTIYDRSEQHTAMVLVTSCVCECGGGNQYLPIDCELIYLLTIYIY